MEIQLDTDEKDTNDAINTIITFKNGKYFATKSDDGTKGKLVPLAGGSPVYFPIVYSSYAESLNAFISSFTPTSKSSNKKLFKNNINTNVSPSDIKKPTSKNKQQISLKDYAEQVLDKYKRNTNSKGHVENRIPVPCPLRHFRIYLNLKNGNVTLRYTCKSHDESKYIPSGLTNNEIRSLVDNWVKNTESEIKGATNTGRKKRLVIDEASEEYLLKNYPLAHSVLAALRDLIVSNGQESKETKNDSIKAISKKTAGREKVNTSKPYGQITAEKFSKVLYVYSSSYNVYLYNVDTKKKYSTWNEAFKTDRKSIKSMTPLKLHRPSRKNTITILRKDPEYSKKYSQLVKEENELYNRLHNSWREKVKKILFGE